jgi:peptidoglycan hydrolase CwlO-like protein
MTNEFLLLISNSFTAIASFFIARRKVNAETDNQVLRNLELSVNLYKQIIDDLKKEIHDLNLKVQDLEKKIDDLHAENRLLKSKASNI